MCPMAMRRLACVLCFAAGTNGAWAVSISSLSEYVQIAGEVGAGRQECNLAYNLNELQKLGQPFQVSQGDGVHDLISDMVAKSVSNSLSRLRDEGLTSACPRLIKAYGPKGTIVPGLLNSPGSN